jgi:hypothetical protein
MNQSQSLKKPVGSQRTEEPPKFTTWDLLELLQLILKRQDLIHEEIGKLWKIQSDLLEANQKFFNYFLKGKWIHEKQPEK